ncbi:MAG: hypothetical protein MI723_16725, partial [Caulobacterales bacterium]|nr:hypothetical protein [Caulobacterales bacterium]
EAAYKLDVALQAYAKAEVVSPTGEDAGFASKRLSELEAAVAPLKEVSATGSDAQQVVARKLLANIEAAAADAYGKDAAVAFANLRAQAANLVGLLDTVDAISARLAFADRDPSAAIADLDDAIAEYTSRRDEVAAQVRGRQAAVDGIGAKIAEQEGTAQAAFAEKMKLESDAFVQKGEEKYATLDAAAQQQAAADAAEVSALKFGSELEKAQVQLEMLQSELNLIDSGLERFEKGRAALVASGKASQEAVAATTQDHQAALGEAATRLAELVKAYQDDVAAPMETAIERAQSAVSQLSGAPRVRGNDVSLDLLEKQLGLTQTLARAAVYAESIEQTVAGIASREGLADRADIRGAADQLAESAAGYRQQASEALNNALDAAQNAPEDDAVASVIRQSLERIQTDLAGNSG